MGKIKIKRHYKNYKVFYNDKIDDVKNGNYPKRYRSEFIEPGICSYKDLGLGIIYVGSDVLDNMNPTFIGKPVINEEHEDLTPEQAFKLSNEDLESRADGVVYEVGRLPNGWFYNDFIVWDLDTQKNIDERGYSVSCAYIVEKSGNGGKYHDIPYDEEVLKGIYTHHCVVPNPRYEGARVYELTSTYQNCRADEVLQIIKNSKGEDNMKMKSKIFKHLLNGLPGKKGKVKEIKNQEGDGEEKKEPDEKDEEMKNMEGSFIQTENGDKIPIEEAVAAYKSQKSNQDGEGEGEGNEEKVLSPEDIIEIDGEEVKVSDLMAACGSYRKNVEQAQDTAAEKVVEEQDTVISNSKKKIEKKNEKKESVNYFKVVKNAAKQTEEPKVLVNTSDERYKRGKERYGSKKMEVV